MFQLTFICILFAIATDAASLLEGRIAGGKDTTIQEFPYQASLRINGKHICAASILTRKNLLTSAQCVNDLNPSLLTVYVGSTNRRTGGFEFKVKTTIQHPKYNSVTLDYDAAIIVLEGLILQYTDKIQPVKVVAPGHVVEIGSKCVISGWGSLSQAGPYVDTLQKAVVPKISSDSCKSKLDYTEITNRMTCYGYENGGSDACEGDSGTALVCNGEQVGVASWGSSCGTFASVYTNLGDKEISHFIFSNI